MDRRDFIKACATVAVASAIDASVFSRALSAQQNLAKKYNKALLVKEDGSPFKEGDIQPQKSYIFFYPHASTPCYLLNLDVEVKPVKIELKNGQSYMWEGGIGSKKSIVAYSAICAHQWSYPTKTYSFINYYPEGQPSETTKKSGIIQCCAHLAVYDPKQGGVPLDGPAEVPLAAIILKQEEDKIYAVGVLGVEQFSSFFDLYKQDLRNEYGSTAKARALVDRCVVMEVERYVQNIIRC